MQSKWGYFCIHELAIYFSVSYYSTSAQELPFLKCQYFDVQIVREVLKWASLSCLQYMRWHMCAALVFISFIDMDQWRLCFILLLPLSGCFESEGNVFCLQICSPSFIYVKHISVIFTVGFVNPDYIAQYINS